MLTRANTIAKFGICRRQGTRCMPATIKPAARRLSAKQSTKMKPSRVAACVRKAIQLKRAGYAAHINAGPYVQNLPPSLTHQGNVLRVDSHSAMPEITY